MEFSHRHFRRDGQDLHLITRGGSAASGGGRRESGASARLALVTTCAQAELAVGEIEATFRQEQAALDAKFAALHRMVARQPRRRRAAARLDPRAAAITAMAAANDERAARAALPPAQSSPPPLGAAVSRWAARRPVTGPPTRRALDRFPRPGAWST